MIKLNLAKFNIIIPYLLSASDHTMWPLKALSNNV